MSPFLDPTQAIDYSLASDTTVNSGAFVAFDGSDSSVNGHCLELETQPKVTLSPDKQRAGAIGATRTNRRE